MRGIAILLALVALAGCSPAGTAIGAGASLAGAAASKRGVSGTARDIRLDAAIRAGWLAADPAYLTSLSAAVVNGEALITGSVPDIESHIAAIAIVWQVEGLCAVIDEVRIGDGADLRAIAEDRRIAARLQAALTFDAEIDALNYSVIVDRGVIHLMGVARDREERQRALAHARQIPGARRLIDHTRLLQSGENIVNCNSRLTDSATLGGAEP